MHTVIALHNQVKGEHDPSEVQAAHMHAHACTVIALHNQFRGEHGPSQVQAAHLHSGVGRGGSGGSIEPLFLKKFGLI